MRASGAYWVLNDQSIRIPGSSGLVGIVAMTTTKGKTKELNLVTADNMESVIGYDLGYNPDYLALSKMLEAVPSLYVMRLNHGAKLGNIYDNANNLTSSDLTEDSDISSLGTTFCVTAKTPGNPSGEKFRIRPVATTQSLAVPEVASSKYTFTLTKTISTTQQIGKSGNTPVYFYMYDSARANIIAAGCASSKVYQVSAGEVTTTELGTYTANSIELDSTKITLSGSTVSIDAYVPDEGMFEFTAAVVEGDTTSILYTKEFSVLANSPKSFNKVNFIDYNVVIRNPTAFKSNLVWDFTALQKGSNGEQALASQLDWSAFERLESNICVLLHIEDQSLITAFGKECTKLYRSLLYSVPIFSQATQVSNWDRTLYRSEYMQEYWIYDQEETEIGNTYIAPSANAFIIYANMLANQGSLNFPPAGYTYGNISITELQETDYALNQDFLKTNCINYQKVGPRGPVMWEQRTRYSNPNSDLSYANTVFILRDLRERILSLAVGYNFLYTTPTMLTTFGRGLRTIFQAMEEAGFISKWKIQMPTFAEAQSSGRNLTIKCSVAVMQDAEDITFDVTLKNYEDID